MAKNIKTEQTTEQTTETTFDSAAFIAAQGGVSKAIRALHAQGHKTGPIAKMLGKRYQHVRNVLKTPVKAVA